MWSTEDFFEEMMKFFPEIVAEITEMKQEYPEGCDTLILEDIIMPRIVALLRRNVETDKLMALFRYFELIACCADDVLCNNFSVCCLEILGNEKLILERAKRYMGPVTARLQREADVALGRKIEE